ncbi:MAG: glycine--tRNA ligase subunit beta [Zetaproteobacteria bacterium]|nr:MAG: glycine--tRNA ligase subunit beta [Zetaproteobacteria bacterium]
MGMAPLLIEIGCQELPAGVAPRMARALGEAVRALLAEHGMACGEPRVGVTPRRLLVHMEQCPLIQPDREEALWGPPERIAFADGAPTRAALGFARKVGLPLDAFTLADKGDGKGRYLHATRTIRGRRVRDILGEAMPAIIRRLPSPKQMRWCVGEARKDTFIRPICWIVARLGEEVIPFSYAGVQSGRRSVGHRVHGAAGEIDVHDPFAWLEDQYVCADRDVRRARIHRQLRAAADRAGVVLVEDEALLDEVTDLVEWPVVVTARYEARYLTLPREVSRIELKAHQRCFSSVEQDGRVSPVFFAVANIESSKPELVARGNERVVNARLADAMFYFERDPKQTLEQRVALLSDVVFQDGLGMVGDQVRRMRGFVLDNADALGVDANAAQRAAYLCKSDLTTGLVGEFPELQGYMGSVYATLDGESEAVARAIAQHYAPVGAEDALPDNAIARAIGIAERADKLLGYFHLGRVPTASADPFGLRRAAIGLIRLLADEAMPVRMSVREVLDEAAKQWNEQRVTIAISDETCSRVLAFIHERLLGMAEHWQVRRQALDASWHAAEAKPLFEQLRLARLLSDFGRSDVGQAVVAANKRIANILKKADASDAPVDPALFVDEAERALWQALNRVSEEMPEAIEGQLACLATLREPVDRFFDQVMVMADDVPLRTNRLALLRRLYDQFLRLADLSRL